MINRKKTKMVKIGDKYIGGDSPILVQSMTTTFTKDVDATVEQILKLEEAGCDIIRVAVPDVESAKAIKDIKKRIHIPLVADIHFDYKLALLAIEAGVDKLRINPGNIGSEERVKAVVDKAKEAGIPIRIGVNGGSLEKDIEKKYGGVTADALVESAMIHVKILEKYDFTDIIVALKCSDVILTLEAYEKLSELIDYPLHIGITESGTKVSGTIKSSVGISALLLNGIGDTLRVSITGDPVYEIEVGNDILKSIGLKTGGVNFISCPTCGRCNIDLEKIALEVEAACKSTGKDITVAVMGCAVNGPGEAKHADIGIAGGDGEALIFKKGIIVKKVKEDELIVELLKEIETL